MDYEALRLQCHDREVAVKIKKNHYDVILRETLQGNVGAAKVLANLMYHFEDIRTRSKEHLNGFLEHSKKHEFTYARIVFWITSTLSNGENIQQRLLEEIKSESKGKTRDELIRALCNLGKLDTEHSRMLLESMKLDWNKSDIEALFILHNPVLDINDVQRIVTRLEYFSDLLQTIRSLEVVAKGGGNRKLLRRLVLPSKKSKKKTVVKGKLELMLQNNHTEKVIAAGDFCMALVEGKPARLVYHFGYGKISGYFYMKNINLKESLTTADKISSDEEDLKNLKSSELDVISGEISDYSPPHIFSEMTEEEKEAEAERFMGLVKKLEDTGIVKVNPK